MSTIPQDVRYALRQLRRSPGFAATVILTMALGIGANSTVFGVLEALILRPLNLPQSGQLYSVNRIGSGGLSPFSSYPDYRDFRERTSTFSDVMAYGAALVGVDYNGTASTNWITPASDNYFQTLRLQPYLGRFFSPADAHGHDSMPYAVLGYEFWRNRFNFDPAIIGKVIQVDKHPFTVIGVAPPSFYGTEVFFRTDLFVPILNERQYMADDFLEARNNHQPFVIGRLKPGVSPAAAAADLNAINGQLAKVHPEDDGYTYTLSKPGLGAGYLRGPGTAALSVIMGLAFLVLIAACANLASLFSARAGDRARELALRLALGSSRRRLLRQLVVESLLLSLIGGALGIVVSQLLLRALSQWRPSADIPIQVNVAPDASLTLLAVLLSIACGVFFGLVPALSVWKNNPYQVIKQGNTGTARGRRLTFRDVLLLLQVVLCAVLVTSSLVAVRGFIRSLHGAYGFQPDGVTLASFDLKMAGYTELQGYQFQRRATEAAAQLPGVAAAAFAGQTPLSMGEGGALVWREGTTDKKPSTSASNVAVNQVSPGYLAVARTRMIAGRDFTWHDDVNSPLVAIVNQTFVREVFGVPNGGNMNTVLGRIYETKTQKMQVIGVVEDGKYENLAEDLTAAFFVPVAQSLSNSTTILVRSVDNANIDVTAQTGAALERLIRQLDPSIPVGTESWRQSLSLAIFPSVVVSVALGTMGTLAAMLALTGIFGMASYAVSRRLRELGIRMALGAARGQLLQAAIGRPMLLLGLGSLLGLGFGALASKVLGVIVYEATSRDPIVLFGVVLSMALIGALAAWLPARRALAVEPSRLLRED